MYVCLEINKVFSFELIFLHIMIKYIGIIRHDSI